MPTPAAQPIRLLIVDDDPIIRDVVRVMLDDDSFEMTEAAHGLDALEKAKASAPDVVLLDAMMPGITGYETCRRLRGDRRTADSIVVILSALDSAASRDEGFAAGADSYLAKPFSPIELLATVTEAIRRRNGGGPRAPHAIRHRGVIRPQTGQEGTPSERRMRAQLMAFAHDLSQMYRRTREQAAIEAELDDADLATVRTLAFVVEAKDPHVRSHLDRSMRYATAVAKRLSPDLGADRVVQYGFLLHDIGKVGIPERILGKPGPLSSAEWNVMRTHPTIGGQIVTPIKGLARAVPIIEAHHERWDGGGYPHGLRGDDIPLGARVFAVADAFDAMTSDRPYRRALCFADAVAEIARRGGSQFDPDVVEAFLAVAGDWREDRESLGAGSLP